MDKDAFKKHFDLPQSGFGEPIDLQDVAAGFSVYKVREERGFKSLIRVYITNAEADTSTTLKEVKVSASYGKESGDGIVVSSSDFKRGLYWPIELNSDKEFFFDTTAQKLLFRTKAITGIELLNLVDLWHTKPTRAVGGFWLRVKLLFYRRLYSGFVKNVFLVLAWLYYLISGEKVKLFDDFREFPNRTHVSRVGEPQITKDKPISLFGYEVEPWIAVLYCAIHLSVYSILYGLDYRPRWIIEIFSNNFLTVIYVVFSLAFANAFLPRIFKSRFVLRPVFKLLQDWYWRTANKSIAI